MPDKVFIDTNIFFYLYSGDELEKQRKAEKAIKNCECIISTQVINEFCNILIKKMKLSTNKVKKAVTEIYKSCTVVKIERETIEQALKLQKEYKYSYYDCLILSSALLSDCKQILTEDLQDRHVIKNRLTITNIVK
ncbi:MAG: PIN domain-containing protein [Leptospirales bacterium]|nr:PIN domain-containing protein [Leptospirales bacterium]